MTQEVAARRSLAELARSYGVQPSYTDASGRRVSTPADGLLGALRALGVPIDRPSDAAAALRARRHELERRAVEPVVVAWDGRIRGVEVVAPRSAACSIRTEDGGRVELDAIATDDRRLALSSRERLPVGYHTLVLDTPAERATAAVFAAPARVPAIAPGSWALFAPLYALRSGRDWGIGSFTELRDLDRWAASRGARMFSTLPLLAAFLDEPFEPSPYSPASRLFWNEVFIDVERVGEVDPTARLDDRARPPANVRTAELVDYRAVASAKRAALEPLADRFFGGDRSESYRRFLTEQPEARSYARFRAEVDRRRTWWGAWPAAARDARLRGAPESDPAGRYHLYAQWIAGRQLEHVGGAAKAEGRGLYLDLPLGVNGASYDVWRHRQAFAIDSSAGAPPDLFFSGGQDWGFPPLHPERIRHDAYAYPRAAVAKLLRYASALRIDHVMGLHRLFWIPHGADASHGAYVRYRADEWYALLSIEAHRAGAAIVGEDLGTVPGYVRRAMRRHRFHTSYVIQFETAPGAAAARRARAGDVHEPPAASAASLGTHDLPTFAAFWKGDDLRVFQELGLLDPADAAARAREREEIRDALVDGLRLRGLLDGGARDARGPERGTRDTGGEDAARFLDAALRFLGRSDASLVVVALADLWLEERPDNVPGTGAERPNWRVRHPSTLDRLKADARVNALIDAIARERSAAGRREAA